MVRAGNVTMTTLSPVPIARGVAPLGTWGHLELSGATSALLRLTWAEDAELPEAVAADLTAGVLLLNDRLGRLLYLPYAAERIVAYDLKEGVSLFPPIVVPRHTDVGLRMGAVRLLPDGGALHLTESGLARFGEDCTPIWRQDGDFLGWAIEAVQPDLVRLVAGDWSGVERRQSRSLDSGRRVG